VRVRVSFEFLIGEAQYIKNLAFVCRFFSIAINNLNGSTTQALALGTSIIG
jgi:hypothetical protein